ncbi:PAAR domain-containing protein [Caballeronia sp. LZ062]|nr:PAAR domain-containing protein [Caballeronia sp. LZ062]MDR5854389.1 PAAR domain-containing protein [Caballeronia sp. LZ050]MDR5871080.1 PAAR domain-containing protein [Caballeronia sp. LZ062]
MRKALVVQGSPTTTGGIVIGGSATHMTDHGKPFALYGDEATCGKCEGAFKIIGTATRRCYRGRAGVLEGDLVLCPCAQNRVMASPDPSCFYDDGDDACLSTQAGNAVTASPITCDEQYVLRDAATGQPHPGVSYKISSSSGQIWRGVTDDKGQTQRLRTSGPATLRLAITEDKNV